MPDDVADLIRGSRGNPKNVVSYKTKDNKIVWFEEKQLIHLKNSTHKQNHIKEINQRFFNNKATENEVIEFLLEESIKVFSPGKTFSGNVNISGKLLHLEIGDNGYLVTAYPI